MRRFILLLVVLGAVGLIGARRHSSDTTYRWTERIDAVGRLLDYKDNRFLGAGFYVSPYGMVLSASHVVSTDTVLFEHVHTNRVDTLVADTRIASHDLLILRPCIFRESRMLGIRIGSAVESLDSVMFLGLRDDRTIFRFDAAISGVGPYMLPGDSIAVRALAIEADVRGGMSGGPVLNDRGEVVAILVGRLTHTPQGGDDSTAVLAIPTDTVKAILENRGEAEREKH